MAQIIVAPNEHDFRQRSVFLAGAIDMGKAPEWQKDAIALLNSYNDLTIFNPRREFTPDTEVEQVEWEMKAMNYCTCILMWFPADTISPITLFEAGIYWGLRKLVVGAEDGYWKKSHLQIRAKYTDYPTVIHNTLEDTVKATIAVLYGKAL